MVPANLTRLQAIHDQTGRLTIEDADGVPVALSAEQLRNEDLRMIFRVFAAAPQMAEALLAAKRALLTLGKEAQEDPSMFRAEYESLTEATAGIDAAIAAAGLSALQSPDSGSARSYDELIGAAAVKSGFKADPGPILRGLEVAAVKLADARDRADARDARRVGIVLEGGSVSAIVSKDPDLIGIHCTIIDYDTEDADPNDLHLVPQSGGGECEAYLFDGTIDPAEIDLGPVSSYQAATANGG